VIEIDPRNATAYYNRGFAYSNLGQWDKAAADFTQTIEINPNFTSAYQNREIAYRKLQSAKVH
jgi:tetratricopeptide (TPR) repeat protein